MAHPLSHSPRSLASHGESVGPCRRHITAIHSHATRDTGHRVTNYRTAAGGNAQATGATTNPTLPALPPADTALASDRHSPRPRVSTHGVLNTRQWTPGWSAACAWGAPHGGEGAGKMSPPKTPNVSAVGNCHGLRSGSEEIYGCTLTGTRERWQRGTASGLDVSKRLGWYQSRVARLHLVECVWM